MMLPSCRAVSGCCSAGRSLPFFAVSLGRERSLRLRLAHRLADRAPLARLAVGDAERLAGAWPPRLLDLFLQLVSLASGAAPVILAFYLLARSGDGAKSIGVDRTQPLRDFLRGRRGSRH